MDIIHVLEYNDIHPPLYFFIMHFILQLPGQVEIVARLPSVLFGTLTVIPLYYMAREFFNDKVGAVAALLYALSFVGITYSREVRMYAMVLFLCTIEMYYFYRALQKNKPLDWGIFSIFAVLAIYTHYYPAIFTGSLVLFGPFYILRQKAPRPPQASGLAKSLAISVAVIIILLLPVFPMAYHQSISNEAADGPHPTDPGFFRDAFVFLARSDFKYIYDNAYSSALAVLFGVLCLFGILFCIRKNFNFLSYLIVIIAVSLLASFILSYKVKFWSYRYIIFLLTPYLLLVANGIGATIGSCRAINELLGIARTWPSWRTGNIRKVFETIPALIIIILILAIVASTIGTLYDGTVNVRLRDAIQYVKDNAGTADHMIIINKDVGSRDYYLNLLGMKDTNTDFRGNYSYVKDPNNKVQWVIIADKNDLDYFWIGNGTFAPLDDSIWPWLNENMHFRAYIGRLTVYGAG